VRILSLTAGLLIAGALLAACGGGNDTEPTPAPSSSPTPTRSGPTPVPGPGVTDTTITLGMTNDLAGSGDTPFSAITLAMQAYFAKVNAEDGGVCGRDVVLATEDDGYSPALALEKTRALVENRGVLAMVGGLGTEAQQGVAAYLNDPNADGDTSDGVPGLFLSSSWSGWADAARYPWTTSYIPDFFTDGIVLARYANEAFPGQKLGIIYADDVMGRDYLAGMEAGVSDAALFVSRQGFPIGAANVVEQVRQVKSDGVEVVMIAASPEMSALAISEANAQDYAPRWLLSQSNAPSTLARRLGGGTSADQLLAGFRMLDGAVSTQFLLSPVEDENDEAILEHARIMQTYLGPTVSSLSVYGQSLAEVTVEALGRACHDLTRGGLMTSVESIKDYRSSLMLEGVSVSLGDTDHRAIQSLQPVVINADSTVIPDGDVISAENVAAPAVTLTLAHQGS
jgi:branched-chain amino acid transport system substrate-binding protein